MERRNVTLSLPEPLLRDAKVLAAQQHLSLSRLMTQALEDVVNAADGFDAARRHLEALMSESVSEIPGGRIDWTRDALHER